MLGLLPHPARSAFLPASRRSICLLRPRNRRPERHKNPHSASSRSRSIQSQVSRAIRAYAALPCQVRRLRVNPGEERIVVEHLLEVRQQPDRVGRVSMETAADLVVDTARRHTVKCDCQHPVRVIVASCSRDNRQQAQCVVRRELGRATEATVLGVESLRHVRDRASKECVGGDKAFRSLRLRRTLTTDLS